MTTSNGLIFNPHCGLKIKINLEGLGSPSKKSNLDMQMSRARWKYFPAKKYLLSHIAIKDEK